MVYILISWCYILFTTITFGYSTTRYLNVKSTDLVLNSFMGLFTVTVLASVFAFFFRINIEFHLLLLLLHFVLLFRFKTEILALYHDFWNQIRKFHLSLKIYLALIFILILAQCATLPYIVDNESYYIQTIKWLNEYGFVKGLANLHIFLGLTSGWHITQSAFSFSFLYDRFNDLSGYCLLLGTIFALEKLNSYFNYHRKTDLLFGLIPLFNVFFFKFISAPSPDIPVYILAFIIFYYFILYYKNSNSEIFTILFLLAVFSVYCKTTSFVILLLPIFYLIKHFKVLHREVLPSCLIGLFVLFLFMAKNTLITGYQLYPLQALKLFNLDYRVPKEVMTLVFNETKLNGYYMTLEQYNTMSSYAIMKNWLYTSPIDSLFNGMTLIILLITPLILYKFYNKKENWIIYSVTLIHLILMFLSSPQYRYFIHFILFFELLLISLFVIRKKTVNLLLFSSLIPVIIVVYLPFDFSGITTNKLIAHNNYFSIKNSIEPAENSKFIIDFETIKRGNLEYHSPIQPYFFWGTYNGSLPTVNKAQVNYFENYLHYIPQQRTDNLADGFFAKKIKTNE